MASRIALSLALVALVVVPSARALKCYQCVDPEILQGITGGPEGNVFNHPLGKVIIPPCKEFDPANPESRFEADCPDLGSIPGAKPGCVKTTMGEVAMRLCQPVIPEVSCQKTGEFSMCFCEGDLCN